MTAKKTASTSTKPVAVKPAPALKWQDVQPDYQKAYYTPRSGGSTVRLNNDLIRKSTFYRMVGRNLMVLSAQRLVSERLLASRMARDYSLLGSRLKLLTATTRVADIGATLFGKNEWRKATEAERKDYDQFIKERDQLVATEQERKRGIETKRLLGEINRAKKSVAAMEKSLEKLIKPAQTKTVNK